MRKYGSANQKKILGVILENKVLKKLCMYPNILIAKNVLVNSKIIKGEIQIILDFEKLTLKSCFLFYFEWPKF